MAIRKNSHNLFSEKTNKSVRKNPNVKNYVKTVGGKSYGDPRKGAKGVAGAMGRRWARGTIEGGVAGTVGKVVTKSPKAKAVASSVGVVTGKTHGNYKSWQNSVKRLNTKKRTTKKK